MIIFWILLGLLILSSAFFAQSEYEKRHLTLTEYEVCSPNLPGSFEGYRVMFLTDLHSVSFGEKNSELTKMLSEAKPDLILIGGDMITVKGKKKVNFAPLRDLLEGIDGICDIPPVYGLGNHEVRLFDKTEFEAEKAEFQALLAKHHVTLLDDGSFDLIHEDGRIRVTGLTMSEAQGRPFKKVPMSAGDIRAGAGEPEGFQTVLFHSPLYVKDFAEWGADLALYGHFHGGTVRLPLLGGVMTPQFQFFYRYCRGLFQFGDKTAIVSGGLGTHSIRIRFMNQPEAIVFVLRGKDRT